MSDRDYSIVEEKEMPPNGKTHVVQYTVQTNVNGEKVERSFNLDPSQDPESHIEQWLHNLK